MNGGGTGVVLITGAGGLLGGEVARALEGAADVRALGHGELDVTDADRVREVVEALRPEAVVHCAAMTNVDACETEPERAEAVNVDGSANVARAADALGAEVVAVSTDYVFDGSRAPYTEEDPPNPIQAYGRTKLGGEEAVRAATDRHYVVRSAWIYGAGGKNFLSKVPGILRSGSPLKAVGDQRSSPTYARDLAGAIVELIGSSRYGTYHVVNEGSCSYAEWCRLAAEVLGAEDVEEISGADLDRPAARPGDTSLDGPAWRAAGFPRLRDWSAAAKAYVAGARV